MTSTVTVKGQTVVPKGLRTQVGIEPGTTLDWRADGDSIRVVKLAAPASGGGFLHALRRMGRQSERVRLKKLM